MDRCDEWRDRHILTDDLHEAFSETIPDNVCSVHVERTFPLTLPLKCLEAVKISYKVATLLLIR